MRRYQHLRLFYRKSQQKTSTSSVCKAHGTEHILRLKFSLYPTGLASNSTNLEYPFRLFAGLQLVLCKVLKFSFDIVQRCTFYLHGRPSGKHNCSSKHGGDACSHEIWAVGCYSAKSSRTYGQQHHSASAA